MAIVGNLTLVISARIGDGEPHDIGEVELPVVTEKIHTVGNVSITARTRVDEVELADRLKDFAAAVGDELAEAAAPERIRDRMRRMIGSALEIDPPSSGFAARLAESKARMAKTIVPSILDVPEHVIIGARQEGKTRLALKWLDDAPEGVTRVLVVKDGRQAEQLNLERGRPRKHSSIIGYRTLINQGARQGVEYGLDETDQILAAVLGLRSSLRLVTVCHADTWQTEP
ncbi:hypothetical protein OCL88_08220 [Paenarthrobacter sp. PAE-2]|uniref:hypothetical protein n=1 Tax=Paenarthrobacter sp. PAE-2 TaxID=2982532 RepID=UPI00222E2EDA|nr:hypothetical protein [Paenarthrobacter sp. PAE-2]MCW3766457.1 hypothetical protein [Paenarthrobacter sp. PAE-2]